MLAEAIAQLKTSQVLLKKFVAGIENPTDDATLIQLRNDLVDYGESLSVVTYFFKDQAENELKNYELRNILQQQYTLLQAIIGELQSTEGQAEAKAKFDLTPGAIRRLTESLKGITELNRTLQKEPNLVVDLTKVPVTKESAAPEKNGFFKRLFKK
ncbi:MULTISPECIES: hypothetical protein [Enterococcus]|uniref:hypothetical protein n=1 Tax=Enterococcus TaxID=1350 RepID=UPI0018A000C1|nr:hypothetical protein [Enterococcus dispar]MCU7356914.1 hypothetical protein [Enterococcus dispar]MDT2705016.1 hypothetical protein [Enterococcus dispar]WCG32519.1 hypothetical protein PML78_09980 [Enterococcus dispar]